MPHHPDHPGRKPGAPTNRTEHLVEVFTRQMRETYVMLGKSLVPMTSNTPEDIQMLLELGEVYEALGCTGEAITTYERARQLNPECLPECVRKFLCAHPDPDV